MQARLLQLRRFLTPPQLADLEEQRQAWVINLILLAMAACMLLALPALPWLTTTESRLQFVVGMGVMLVTGLIGRRLLFSGRVVLAGRLVFGMLWLVLLALSIRGSGLTSMAYLATLALTPLLAGLLVGSRAPWLVSGINFLLGGVFMMAEINGTLPVGTTYAPPARMIAYVALFGALPLMAYVWRRSFVESTHHYRQLLRTESEAALLRRNKADLEHAVAVATTELAETLARERALAENLEDALQRERQLGDVKTAIIRNLSHEFRTPLTVINTNVDLLWRYSDRLSDAKKEQYRGGIKASVQYLTGLLDDISAASRVGEPQAAPETEEISYQALCGQLRADVEYMLAPGGAGVFDCTGEERTLRLPVTAVRAILRQLVGNAAKFGAQKAAIRVLLVLTEDELLLTIHDDGIGIPAGETDHIFDLFVRGSNVGARRGLGLGLYLALTNVQSIDGRLTAASDGPDLGATFTATIPLNPTTSATATAPDP